MSGIWILNPATNILPLTEYVNKNINITPLPLQSMSHSEKVNGPLHFVFNGVILQNVSSKE